MRIIFILYALLLCSSSFGQERLVNIDGNKYNVFLKGFEKRKPNTPAIIFEGGLGSNLSTWDKIVDQLSQFAPVFSYDRSGIGRSDKTFKAPTIKTVSVSLKNILKALEIPPPYILVAIL